MFFGLSPGEIKQYFYRYESENTLFGEQEVIKKVMKPIEAIADVYSSRLRSIWNYVTDRPLILDNSKGVPLFHLVFASNNVNAVKIAGDIITTV
jgi:hypothetical protein